MIQLEVPEGDECAGCMFLLNGMWDGTPWCRLFDRLLDVRHGWALGGAEGGVVVKLDACPRAAGSAAGIPA